MATDMAEPTPQALLDLLDPELIEGALLMRAMAARTTPMTCDRLAERRTAIAAMTPPLVPGIAVERRIVPGPHDHPDLVVHVVNARPGSARPAIVHMHGGGFTAGSSRGAVPHLQETAAALDCVIVSVDFRNAPETRFDRSLEDDHAALVWTHEDSEALGIDRRRIALMGESGGGGHAALLAMLARDRGEVPVCFQALIYPMLDDRTGIVGTPPAHAGAFGWNADANRFGWRCFLGRAPGGAERDGVPARAEDLAGLPATFIAVGALDLFASENMDFARRLNEAGIPIELLVVPGAYHGFDLLSPESRAARRFTAAKHDALRRAFSA